MRKYLLTIITFSAALWSFGQLSELPITLSMPFDEDTIEEMEPVFIWQSNLAAIQNDIRLSQRLTVVKLLENQTPLEGIALNNPVFLRENLTSSTLPYSSTDHELIDNTWYAWQVSYLMNGQVIGQSEVWKFIRVKPVPPPREFVALRRQNDGAVYTTNGNELAISTTQKSKLELQAQVIYPDGHTEEKNLAEFINGELSESTESLPVLETRYFVLDIAALNPGRYKLLWNGSGSASYTINFLVP